MSPPRLLKRHDADTRMKLRLMLKCIFCNDPFNFVEIPNNLSSLYTLYPLIAICQREHFKRISGIMFQSQSFYCRLFTFPKFSSLKLVNKYCGINIKCFRISQFFGVQNILTLSIFSRGGITKRVVERKQVFSVLFRSYQQEFEPPPSHSSTFRNFGMQCCFMS